MQFIDIIFLIIIGGFAMFGFWFGFFHTVGSFFGTILGILLASRYYGPMADWLASLTGWGENISKVIMFVIAFFVINRIVGFLFWIVDKVFSVVTHLPFISSINRLSGLVLGFFEGVITLALVIYFIERFPLSDRLMDQLSNSQIAPTLSGVADLLVPLLPTALKMLHSTVEYVETALL